MDPRHTGRGIVIHDGQILLMERWRPGKHYFSIPGGGIEPGETAADAAVREIREETSCTVSVLQPLYTLTIGDNQNTIFLCQYQSGEVHLPGDSPEALEMTDDNRFKPTWLPLADLATAPFLIWAPVQKRLLHDLAHGFAQGSVELSQT